MHNHDLANPTFSILQPDDLSTYAVDKINSLLEGFMGINDNDLGMYAVLNNSGCIKA